MYLFGRLPKLLDVAFRAVWRLNRCRIVVDMKRLGLVSDFHSFFAGPFASSFNVFGGSRRLRRCRGSTSQPTETRTLPPAQVGHPDSDTRPLNGCIEAFG